MNNPFNYNMPNNLALKNKYLNKNEENSASKEKINKSDRKIDQYKEQSIMTASPEELTMMLYDGTVKFLKKAKIHIEQNNIEKINNSLIRAQDIIAELNATLNMDYEISKDLNGLYDFMIRRITDANIEKSAHIVDEVLDLAIDLRDTWKEAMAIAQGE